MNRRRLGQKWEDEACAFLEKRGIRIKSRNFKAYRGGEIDIVGIDKDGTWVFTEVKYRKNAGSGYGEEAVGFKKIYNICRAADFYRVRYALPATAPFRFDVISVNHGEISWIKNAFDYIGKG